MIALDKQLKISIDISLIISQKSGSQNRCFKKTKYAKFSEKRTFLTPCTYVCVSGGKKCSFFGKSGMLCFLETPVLRFTLLSYYLRIYHYHGHSQQQ